MASAIIFSASAADVVYAAVAGKSLFEGGEVTTVDEQRVTALVNTTTRQLGGGSL